MNDYLVSATGANGMIRAHAVRTTELTDEARKIHDLYPTSADALGRVLTATVLLGQTLKSAEDSITVRVMGDGPLGAVIAVGNRDLEVRGYVQNPHVNMPVEQYGTHAFAKAVGMGNLYITRDLGLKEPYTGSVPLTSGEIASDLIEYFMTSEQTPTACGLGVYVEPDGRIGGAGGFLAQLLPGATDEVACQLEQNVLAMPPLSGLYRDGGRPEDVLARVFDGLDYRIHENKPASFRCTCSRERYRQILSTLSEDELNEMVREDGGAEAVCHFCNARYWFDEQELKDVIDSKKGMRS